MNDIILLLRPAITGIKNRLKGKGQDKSSVRVAALFTLGICFWCAVFWVSHRVLLYFSSIEKIGELLSFKLLSMIVTVAFFLLLISSIITSVSRFYLSKDLIRLHSMPVPAHKLLISRWLTSLLDSSWMVLIYIFPILLSYIMVFDKGVFSFVIMIFATFSLAVTASAIGSIAVIILVIVIPAGRLKRIVLISGLLLFVFLYIGFRMLKPEQLVDPEAFQTVLAYIASLETPSSPFFPGSWVFDSLKAALRGSTVSAVLGTCLSWSFSLLLVYFLVFFSEKFYRKGVSKNIGSADRSARPEKRIALSTKFLSPPVHALTVKEIKTFFRDQTQWSQIFLVAALILIYLYNFTVLPIEKAPIQELYLQNLLSFLNMGLALFVLTSVAARFAFPAVSLESESFWIIRSSPVSISRFLWIKFFIHYIPLLFLTEFLVIVTNLLLDVTPFIMLLSVVTVFFLVPPVVMLAVGIGSIYADFRSENPLKSVTGFGGVLYMILCAVMIGLVIMLEAGPVYAIFMAGIKNRALTAFEVAWSIIAFSLVPVISIIGTVVPVRMGAKHLAAAG